MPEHPNRSRRDFLTKGLQTATFASIATAIPGIASAGQSPSCIDPTQLKWDEEMDILVVGSGIAGSVAAIKAAETRTGMKIVIADKMSRLGGSSLISGLNMAVVGSEWQKAMGVTDDSWERLYEDMEKESRGFNHPEISKVVAQNSLKLFSFMIDHGVEYDKSMGNGTGVKDLGGHSRARVVWPKEGGTGVIKNLHAYMARHLPNIEIRKRVKLEEIYRNNSGRVVGVRVREEYFFDLDTPDFGRNDDPAFNSTGVTKLYKVKRALVMASGGFNQDRKFRGDEIGVLYDCVSTASPGATGGALKCMMQAGFKPVHMTLFRFAFPIPTEDINWGILVNPQTCKRFINEHNNNDRQGLGLAILSERRKLKPGQQAILIYDQTGIDSYHDKQRLQLSLEAKNGTEGTIWKFDTLAALAARFEMDLAKLEATIAEYNANMARDQDAFGKPKSVVGKATAIGRAPYYAMYLNPRYNYSQGGALISPRAEALDVVSQQPIPGVFVCGEAAAGTFGYIRLTACSSLDSGVYGMIAGENAANEEPWA